MLCTCILGKSGRFGISAKTLHMPSRPEWDEKFVVLHADDLLKDIDEVPADDVDRFLRRFRRDASDARGIARTVVSEIAVIRVLRCFCLYCLLEKRKMMEAGTSGR